MATEITTWAELAAINSALSGDYILMNDLDSSSPGYDTYAGPSANGGLGWIPLGNSSSRFTGSFDGNNHTIYDIVINRTGDYTGFFGYMREAGETKNLSILNADISGGASTGIMVGLVDRCDSFSDCEVSGSIVATGDRVGGFVGHAYHTPIDSCKATGISIDATNRGERIGGFVGDTDSPDGITNSYAMGSIENADSYNGGFAGYSCYLSVTSNCYAVVTVDSGGNSGFSGFTNSATITNCFWDTEATGISGSNGGTGKTTAQMQDISTFSAWDISAVANTDTRDTTHIWNIVDDSSYPFLSSEVAPIAPSDDDPGDDPGEIVKSVTSNIFGDIINQ